MRLCVLVLLLDLATSFRVIWNVPNKRCVDEYKTKPYLKRDGIEYNKNYEFQGDKIVIFYEKELGLYPWIIQDEETGAIDLVNGGLPQLVNLTAHLTKAAKDIQRFIPDKHFNGLAIIDWEKWRPIYRTNWSKLRIYQKYSKKLTRSRLAPLTQKAPYSQLRASKWYKNLVKREAKRQFEKSAKILMTETLRLAKQLRPDAHWGFYGYPECFAKEQEQKHCDRISWPTSNRLRWLYRQSTALYPTIYLRTNSPLATHQIRSRLKLAYHYAGRTMPVYAYSKVIYDAYTEPMEFYSNSSLCSTMLYAVKSGIDGIIIWSSSYSTSTRERCNQLSRYMIDQAGPLLRRAIKWTERCRVEHCENSGRCVQFADDDTCRLDDVRELKKSMNIEISKPATAAIGYPKGATKLELPNPIGFLKDLLGYSKGATKSTNLPPGYPKDLYCLCDEGFTGKNCELKENRVNTRELFVG